MALEDFLAPGFEPTPIPIRPRQTPPPAPVRDRDPRGGPPTPTSPTQRAVQAVLDGLRAGRIQQAQAKEQLRAIYAQAGVDPIMSEPLVNQAIGKVMQEVFAQQGGGGIGGGGTGEIPDRAGPSASDFAFPLPQPGAFEAFLGTGELGGDAPMSEREAWERTLGIPDAFSMSLTQRLGANAPNFFRSGVERATRPFATQLGNLQRFLSPEEVPNYLQFFQGQPSLTAQNLRGQITQALANPDTGALLRGQSPGDLFNLGFPTRGFAPGNPLYGALRQQAGRRYESFLAGAEEPWKGFEQFFGF